MPKFLPDRESEHMPDRRFPWWQNKCRNTCQNTYQGYVTGHVRPHGQNTCQQGRQNTVQNIVPASMTDDVSEHKSDLMPEQAAKHCVNPHVGPPLSG